MQNAGSKPPSRATGPSMTTARDSTVSASSSQLNGAIDELKGFNTQLKDELMELKGYLRQTNERLRTLEGDEGSVAQSTQCTTARSRSSAGYTNRTRSTARSDVSSVISDARQAIAR